MERINIIINEKPLTGNQGESILTVCRENDIKIPTLCFDPRLEPYSSCFVCVVQVEGMKGLQPACSTIINEGMKIETENDKVRKARKTSLELLLSNHYADCVAPCKEACPASVDIQGYISLIEKGLYSRAIELIKQVNNLPAICGRICVRPCEDACRRNLLDEGSGVGIDYMKRFAADNDLQSSIKYVPEVETSTGKNVAVIGAGPAGLSCANYLQQKGHQVDIYEAMPKSGGWLRYGIPEYRLPNEIIEKETDLVTDLGVQIFYNHKLGENVLYEDLKEKYDSLILTIGSQKGTGVGCEGDDAINVLSGVDYLREMEVSGEKKDFNGKTVVVVGGGNTAMDCCRSSMRCNAEKIYVVYRRTEKEMPANPIEIHEAKLEGIEFLFLNNPLKINKNKKGEVESVTLLKMELGEPDASGRRRPVPVEGSEYNLNVDFVIAAIGQKTEADFLENINKHAPNGELKLNRWGDIDANPETLQTGIESIFAAGDGVTGAATVIQALSQSNTAAKSCHQFLMGEKIAADKKEFISKKENFKEQESEEYIGKFVSSKRHEMPILPPEDRLNFSEVELGYKDNTVATEEANRCLECGCTEYFSCDLKNYATEYECEQLKFEGNFNEYQVDFSHPFIEINTNKCILCTRCIRVCKEVVGANALGLIGRGFETYVAPSMGNPLQETTCESCGLCISACPTGSITENVNFKPGPVEAEKMETICNYCSIGCKIEIHHTEEYTMQVTGVPGDVNTDGNLCKYAKFGYKYLNDKNRIINPMLKVNGKFTTISYGDAYEIIREKIQASNPDENSFFAGARLSNEELYLIQKFARAAVKTNNIGSFHYLGRGSGYFNNVVANTSFDQLKDAGKIYLLGTEISTDNAVAGFMVNKAHNMYSVPVELITVNAKTNLNHKVDSKILVKSYYHFVKATIHYLISNKLQNQMFIDDNCSDYSDYTKQILKEDYKALCKTSGVSEKIISDFAVSYNKQQNAIILFAEKDVSSNTCVEIHNLAMITGKLGKTASGLISLKEKNNSQGLIDMGIDQNFGVGYQNINDTSYIEKLKSRWNIDDLPKNPSEDMLGLLEKGKLKNLFIFGEDPIGCAKDKKQVKKWINNADFVVAQEYFMSETAKEADLILPAALPIVFDGTFTNTQKVIQEFYTAQGITIECEKLGYEQILDLMVIFNCENVESPNEILNEAISILPITEEIIFKFNYTEKCNNNRIFDFGCDNIIKRFDDDFKKSFEN